VSLSPLSLICARTRALLCLACKRLSPPTRSPPLSCPLSLPPPLLHWPPPTSISTSLSGACDASARSARRLAPPRREKKNTRPHLVVIIRNARVCPALSAMGGPAPPAPPSSPFPFIGSRPYVGVVLLVKLARGRRTLVALPTSSHASLAHSYPRATPAREYTVMLARSRMSCLTQKKIVKSQCPTLFFLFLFFVVTPLYRGLSRNACQYSPDWEKRPRSSTSWSIASTSRYNPYQHVQ
jgi:hypothetical protein